MLHSEFMLAASQALSSFMRVSVVEIFCISKVNSIILNNVDQMLQSIRPGEECASNFIDTEFLWICACIN